MLSEFKEFQQLLDKEGINKKEFDLNALPEMSSVEMAQVVKTVIENHKKAKENAKWKNK